MAAERAPARGSGPAEGIVADGGAGNARILHAWRIHPAADRPGQAALVAAFVVATAALAGFAFRDLFLALLALVIFSLSLTTYFLPTRYALRDGDGPGGPQVLVNYPFSTRREPLARFRSVVEDRNGLLLSPARDHRLVHELRSLFLIVPRAERETVKRLITSALGAAADAPPPVADRKV